MDTATVLARPSFADVEPEAQVEPPLTSDAPSSGQAGRYRALDPTASKGPSQAVRGRSGIRSKQVGTRPEGSWGTAREPPVDPSQAAANGEDLQRVSQRYAGLSPRALPTDRRDAADPARLAAPRRSELGRKGLADPDDDALLAEISRGYSREYRGREGWSAGALWDSLSYTFRLAGRSASRPLAIRRLQRERAARERVRQDQLVQLGELALGLTDLKTPVLDEFRDRLLEIDQEVEMREEEREELNTRLADADRDHAAAERQHALVDQELTAQCNSAEEQLRPEEAAHRNAMTKARAAEKDALALGQQIDRAQAELRALGQRPGSGQEVARLKDRIGKWEADRRILEEEAPRLAEKAERLLPEIELHRKEVARAQQARRDHREEGIRREAQHRRERSRLMQEMERLNLAKETLAAARRGLWLECGRQIDIDRPSHDHLMEMYHVVDHTAAEIRRIDQESEIAGSHPGPPSWDAITRALVALSAALVVFILFLFIVT